MGRPVVIGGAAGAWGDSSLSTDQLLADGRCDYIFYEGLAEITMAILSRARSADPALGYARDLIETIADNAERFREADTKVVTNAGGVNPRSAAELISEAAPSAKVAVVTGDQVDASRWSDALSVNAYLGARPIAAALDKGADIVITGRVVDSALALGPLIHEFGWGPEEFDLLSAGSLVGHLLECGPQSTGGLMTDWEDTSSWANPGFPIAEVESDGSFVVTAPEASDALVDERTVSEQLLYEIGDPGAYLLPDVTCDWSAVRLESVGANRVRVTGAIGKPPPPTLKACAQIPDGWRAQFLLFIGGHDAVGKAERVGRDLVARGEQMVGGFRQTSVEVLGSESTYGPHSRARDSREVVLKIGVHHDSRDAISRFVREVPSIALAGPPGVGGGGSGLPRPTPLIRLECFLIDRSEVGAVVDMAGSPVEFVDVDPAICASVVSEPVRNVSGPSEQADWVEVPLRAIAHGRSGDKGADVNIGLRARHPDFLPHVKVEPERLADWLAHLKPQSVEMYDLPGIGAVNYLLRGGLGAGGTASLRFDPQGKAVAQQALDMTVTVPPQILEHPAFRQT